MHLKPFDEDAQHDRDKGNDSGLRIAYLEHVIAHGEVLSRARRETVTGAEWVRRGMCSANVWLGRQETEENGEKAHPGPRGADSGMEGRFCSPENRFWVPREHTVTPG